MRHEKASSLLALARLLASSAEGLTLDEMAERMGVGRRTAERMRDAARELFPQMEEIDDPPTRRFRIAGGLDGLFLAPDADELAALRGAAETLASQGAVVRAAALRELERKILASMRASARRRVAPDLEALVQAETIAAHAGPRPYEDAGALAVIRQAIKGMNALSFVYDGGSSPGRRREVTPLGILFGRSNYLVASEADGRPRSWRFDRMREVTALDRPAPPPEDFSLQDFADESFGIYHGALEDVVLVIDASRREDALAWRFHRSQTVVQLDDGRVRVSFRAGGMLELAWHLFTWGDAVEIVSPPSLKAVMAEELKKALARCQA
ncbi:helix-turn-helix transcriptional regulator [Caulobacter sp. KR2-114]|uniref:helix-turn-helix transcriptional regulator n=1 Tax=Caulobacter sp. KR2-114 TaxID=3400912 RepID=UPI003BFB55FE